MKKNNFSKKRSRKRKYNKRKKSIKRKKYSKQKKLKGGGVTTGPPSSFFAAAEPIDRNSYLKSAASGIAGATVLGGTAAVLGADKDIIGAMGSLGVASGIAGEHLYNKGKKFLNSKRLAKQRVSDLPKYNHWPDDVPPDPDNNVIFVNNVAAFKEKSLRNTILVVMWYNDELDPKYFFAYYGNVKKLLSESNSVDPHDTAFVVANISDFPHVLDHRHGGEKDDVASMLRDDMPVMRIYADNEDDLYASVTSMRKHFGKPPPKMTAGLFNNYLNDIVFQEIRVKAEKLKEGKDDYSPPDVGGGTGFIADRFFSGSQSYQSESRLQESREETEKYYLEYINELENDPNFGPDAPETQRVKHNLQLLRDGNLPQRLFDDSESSIV
jgi:hypothetical protein